MKGPETRDATALASLHYLLVRGQVGGVVSSVGRAPRVTQLTCAGFVCKL